MTDQTVQTRFARGRNQGQQALAPRFRLVGAPKGVVLNQEEGSLSGAHKFKNPRKSAGLLIERFPGRGQKISKVSIVRA